jgi:hypothetical protein
MPTPVSSIGQRDAAPLAGCADKPQRASVRHRLTRVDGQVEQRLPERLGVAVNRWQVERTVAHDADVGAGRIGFDDPRDALQQSRRCSPAAASGLRAA